MTPENLMNTSIDTLAMQHATTADRAPPHAGIDTAATPMAASGLDKRYDGQPALDHVSLQLEPGTVLGLIGRNGAGKTTLIRALLGWSNPTPAAPASGAVPPCRWVTRPRHGCPTCRSNPRPWRG